MSRRDWRSTQRDALLHVGEGLLGGDHASEYGPEYGPECGSECGSECGRSSLTTASQKHRGRQAAYLLE